MMKPSFHDPVPLFSQKPEKRAAVFMTGM